MQAFIRQYPQTKAFMEELSKHYPKLKKATYRNEGLIINNTYMPNKFFLDLHKATESFKDTKTAHEGLLILMNNIIATINGKIPEELIIMDKYFGNWEIDHPYFETAKSIFFQYQYMENYTPAALKRWKKLVDTWEHLRGIIERDKRVDDWMLAYLHSHNAELP